MREIRKSALSSSIGDKLSQLRMSETERAEALAALRNAEYVSDVLVGIYMSVRHALTRLSPKPGLGA